MFEVQDNLFYAMDCLEQNGMHVWDDAFYVEALDEKNEVVGPGEVGKLTLTNLFAEGTPIIRYKTDIDVSIEEGVCACGRAHTRIVPPGYR